MLDPIEDNNLYQRISTSRYSVCDNGKHKQHFSKSHKYLSNLVNNSNKLIISALQYPEWRQIRSYDTDESIKLAKMLIDNRYFIVYIEHLQVMLIISVGLIKETSYLGCLIKYSKTKDFKKPSIKYYGKSYFFKVNEENIEFDKYYHTIIEGTFKICTSESKDIFSIRNEMFLILQEMWR